MGDSKLIPFDTSLLEKIEFVVDLSEDKSRLREIEFQFPPKIVSDSNAGLWLEVDIWGIEPLRIHKGSAGRKVEVEWEYIATDSIFTPAKINEQIKRLKSYFFEFKRGVMPVVNVTLTKAIEPKVPFRIHDVAITHGPEIIKNGEYYPLYTKVAMAMSLATTVSVSGGRSIGSFASSDNYMTSGKLSSKKDKDEKARMKVANLEAPPKEWW